MRNHLPMGRRATTVIAAATIALLSSLLGPVGGARAAAPTTLPDPTYGAGGSASFLYDGQSINASHAELDPEGRLVVVATTASVQDAVFRFEADGGFDESFGDDGVHLLPARMLVADLAVSTEGIAISGSRHDERIGNEPIPDTDALLVKLTPEGEPDLLFDLDGVLEVGGPTEHEGFGEVAIDAANRLLVQRSASLTNQPGRTWLERRLPVGGVPDPVFGSMGRFELPQAGTGRPAQARSILVDDEGRITIAATVFADLSGRVQLHYVARFTPDGAADASFGSAGLTSLGRGYGYRATFGPGGSTFLLAQGEYQGGSPTVIKLTPAGFLDPTFSKDGVAYPAVVEAVRPYLAGIEVLPNGSVLVGEIGTRDPDGSPVGTSTAVTLLRPDGRRDQSFGLDGNLRIDGFYALGGLRLADGNRLLVVGRAGNDATRVVARAYRFDTVPSAPAAAVLTPGRGFLRVDWQAPVRNGGAPVVAYRVLARAGGRTVTERTVAGDVRSVSLDGLINGVAYDVTVVPYNVRGEGLPSPVATMAPATNGPVRTASGPPRNVQTIAGPRAITVTWAPPAFDGGAAIQAYAVVAVHRASGEVRSWRNVPADVRTVALPNLTAGADHDISIYPVTAAGYGAGSATVRARPSATGTPGKPTVGYVVGDAAETAQPSLRTLYVSWGPPAERDAPLAGYHVVVLQEGVMRHYAIVGPEARSVAIANVEHHWPADVYVVPATAATFGALPEPTRVLLQG